MGPDASIRIDANEAWDLEEAKQQLAILMEYNIESVEQPMPAINKEDYPDLLSYLDKRVLVSLDESLCSYSDGKWMAENKGGSLFNLRVSKNGGLIKQSKAASLSRKAWHSMSTWCSSRRNVNTYQRRFNLSELGRRLCLPRRCIWYFATGKRYCKSTDSIWERRLVKHRSNSSPAWTWCKSRYNRT